MKTATLVLLMVIAPPALAQSAKAAVCDAYVSEAYRVGTENVSIDQISHTLNVAFELGFDEVDERSMSVALRELIASHPEKNDALNNQTYWACSTPLTEEDKAVARDFYRRMIGK